MAFAVTQRYRYKQKNKGNILHIVHLEQNEIYAATINNLHCYTSISQAMTTWSRYKSNFRLTFECWKALLYRIDKWITHTKIIIVIVIRQNYEININDLSTFLGKSLPSLITILKLKHNLYTSICVLYKRNVYYKHSIQN